MPTRPAAPKTTPAAPKKVTAAVKQPSVVTPQTPEAQAALRKPVVRVLGSWALLLLAAAMFTSILSLHGFFDHVVVLSLGFAAARIGLPLFGSRRDRARTSGK